MSPTCRYISGLGRPRQDCSVIRGGLSNPAAVAMRELRKRSPPGATRLVVVQSSRSLGLCGAFVLVETSGPRTLELMVLVGCDLEAGWWPPC